ncbi:MAG: YncE family protein [Solirubrobacterales bacterium]|nr:YncE family protein [Solirubrobacterales bacterium]
MRVAAASTAICVAVAGALAVSGCGSEAGNPPPAEPAVSPTLTAKPVGTVIPGKSEAEGVVADAETGLAAVSFRDPNVIELIDVADAKVARRVRTPDESRHLALAGPGGPVLAPIEYRDLLLRIELPSGKITSRVKVGDFPHDAAQADDGRVFVTDEGGDAISVVDGDSVEATLPVPEQPGGIAVAGNVVGAVTAAAREMAFYDAGTLEQTAVLPGGAGPSHVVAGTDDRFYVADTAGDAILVYRSVPEPELIDRTNVPDSPYGIAIDERRDHLWVTRTGANRVVELEITDLAPKIIDSFPTVREPNGVAVDERTGSVVVVSRSSGDVQIFDPAAEREGSR